MRRSTSGIGLLLAGALPLIFASHSVHAQPAAKPEVSRLRIGTAVFSDAFVATYVGDRRGIFEKHGVKVEVLPFQGGPKAIQALLAGEIEVFEGDFTPVLSTYGSGEELVVFAQTVVPPHYRFVGRQGITSWQKLAESRGVVGVSAIGGIDYIVVRYAMSRAGVDPNSVRYIAAGSPLDRANALMAGRLELIASTVPGYYLLEQRGLPTIGQLKDVLDRFPLEQFATTRKFHAANPNTINAIVAAHREAVEWTRQNQAGATDILMDVLKAKPDQREIRLRALGEIAPYLAPRDVTEEGYRLLVQFYIDEGRIKDPVDVVLGKLLTFWKKR